MLRCPLRSSENTTPIMCGRCLQVALRRRAAGKRDGVNAGETVPYIICVEKAEDGSVIRSKGLAERAHHPDELRENVKLDIDKASAAQVVACCFVARSITRFAFFRCCVKYGSEFRLRLLLADGLPDNVRHARRTLAGARPPPPVVLASLQPAALR